MGDILNFSKKETHTCSCGEHCTCGKTNEVIGNVELNMAQCCNKPLFQVASVSNTLAKIGNVFISEKMFADIDANKTANVNDVRALIFKVSGVLWDWEEKHKITHQFYILSGFSDINHCKFESVNMANNTVSINGIVAAMVNNGNMEISAFTGV